MSQPPTTPAPLPPGGPPPESHYDAKVVALAAVLTLVGAAMVTIGPTAVIGFTPSLLGILAVPVLLVVGIVLTVRSTTRRDRSIWLGIVIGCGVALVVGGGLCVALLVGLSQL